MIRNLKVIGLALVAVFALSAIAASTASAQNGKLTSTGNVTLTGTEIPGSVNALTFNGTKVECPGSTYVGHKVGGTGFLTSGSSEATITPTYKQPCTSTLGPATVDLNGCDYVIHLGPTTGVAKQYSATYDITGCAGKEITVTSWASSAEHTGLKEACVQHIAPQAGLAGGTITDNGNGDLKLEGPVKGIEIVQTKDGLHPLLCPAKLGNGELDINVTVTGHNENLTATTISLSHT